MQKKQYSGLFTADEFSGSENREQNDWQRILVFFSQIIPPYAKIVLPHVHCGVAPLSKRCIYIARHLQSRSLMPLSHALHNRPVHPRLVYSFPWMTPCGLCPDIIIRIYNDLLMSLRLRCTQSRWSLSQGLQTRRLPPSRESLRKSLRRYRRQHHNQVIHQLFYKLNKDEFEEEVEQIPWDEIQMCRLTRVCLRFIFCCVRVQMSLI